TDLLLPNLTEVDGDFIVTGNPDLTTLSVPQLTMVGGNVDISDNPLLTSINLGSVTSVGGSVSVNGDTSATSIDLGSLADVGGGVSVNGDTAATSIELSSLHSVSGSVSISGNTAATSVELSSLFSVGGDETLEAMNSITSVAADGSTEVTLFTAAAQMTAALAAGTFDHAVAFTVIRLDPAALPPEDGLDSSGGPATIDPLAAYQFDFGIPTLGQDASLTFEINVGALSAADRDAFLTALAAGNATVAVKNDAAGSVYQAFAISAPGQPADATHVTITQPDPDHIIFQGVTGHFSTFAVVIVSPTSGNSPPVARDDVAVLDTSSSASITINVLGNDFDLNGDALTVTAVTQPASGHGIVTINANGTLTYTQTVFVNGTETFTYTISDGQGGTATATVTVTVRLPARIGIDMLRSQVQHAGLRHGLQISLDVKLRAAQQALAKGNSRAASGLLGAFANEVRAFKRAHLLPPSLADLWLLEAANILAEIGRR
ncbi:MAG: cadherin-like domain-containing protein, partial [Planctomycetales bacterium]|nr:cadherin-like domain-containing protein [Planctomycetales bacterium]